MAEIRFVDHEMRINKGKLSGWSSDGDQQRIGDL